MLNIYTSSGRKPEIPPKIQQALINELTEKEGFSSYKEIQIWLYTVHNLNMSYKVVHDTVRYRLKAKLKVPRRSNTKKGAAQRIAADTVLTALGDVACLPRVKRRR